MPRAFQWFTRTTQDNSLASGGQECLNLLTNMNTGVMKSSTITRIVLRLYTRADTVAQQTFASYGVVLVNADAAAASAFPDADIDTDNVAWLVRGMHLNSADSLPDASQFQRSDYDLRAQRVLRSAQEELHFIIDQGSGGGIFYSVHARVLMRLP